MQKKAEPNSVRQPIITVRDLHHSYREGPKRREVLRGISANIMRGECVALLGQSGSGKSTLLNLIGGLDSPDSGRITVSNVILTTLNERDRTLFRRRHLGLVYQFFNLVPTLTVEENVLLPLELNKVEKARARDRAITLLEDIGLGNRLSSYPDRLSGGEQQRVAIARALVHDPLVILADEPTGNLDSRTGKHVLQLLDRLVRRDGKTLLVVTHARDVAAFADRLLWLEDGRVANSSPESLSG